MEEKIKITDKKIKKTATKRSGGKKEPARKTGVRKASSVKNTDEQNKVGKAVSKAKGDVVITAVTESVITVHAGMTVDVFNGEGKKTGTMELPKEVFGAKINKTLIAQAVRIYLVNQRLGTVSTKTRGEVAYSTRKIYQQKGTGRARHGGRGAPLFVKGGVAHGPHQKDYELKLSKTMKKAAFTAALSAQKKDTVIAVIAGIENMQPKTKAAAHMLSEMGIPSGRKVLFVLSGEAHSVRKPLRNLAGVEITTAQRVNTYDIISYKHILFEKEAIDVLVKRVQ